MNTWYTAQELAGLPDLPSTPRAIRSFAQRAGWNSQRRIGSKASEYAFTSLPAGIQQALLAKAVGASTSPETIERDALSSSRLNDKQRSVMAARLAFIREIEHLGKVTSQRQAIALLVTQAKAGELSPYLAERLERTNDRKASGRNLSERTLKRWLADYKQHGESGLAPARRKADVSVPEWAADFLRCYQRPTKPSVEASYAEFAGKHSGERPSIHQVRRFLNKLSVDARMLGRCSAQEGKAHKTFNRRDTKNMLPGEVYTADGHTFDAEVLNPRTGKPYRPEITTVIDVATRRALGFSVGEAESHIVVLDALRDAVQRGGMFVMFYVDNGQARGLIERAHQTIWVNAAKKIPSYLGADMDQHAGNKVHKITRQQLRDAGRTSLMPTFAKFLAGAEAELEAYNHRPHRGLPKIRDPQTYQRRHMTPQEAWDAAIAKGWQPPRHRPRW